MQETLDALQAPPVRVRNGPGSRVLRIPPPACKGNDNPLQFARGLRSCASSVRDPQTERTQEPRAALAPLAGPRCPRTTREALGARSAAVRR